MIKVMDEILANKIKAGEVVEKCVSVVKELVENSIDAKSTSIEINLLESGTRRIRVIDNGIGMDKKDATKCFLRHATSKLIEYEDLYSLDTLGFRGEALPSIASVSNINLKTSNKIVGTEVILDGGNILEVNTASLREGTNITVDNLFFNTPARLKHLSSLYAQLANIVGYINKVCLSHPHIKFTLTNDEKTLINTPGDGNLLKAINSVYGLEVTKKMVKIENENNDYQIEGYISYPEVNRASKDVVTMIVNNRYVKNYEIIKTINDAYHTFKPENRYPVVVLKINCDSSLIDVNIHPTKMDIKFSKMQQLKELISETVKSKLNVMMLIPSVKEDKPKEILQTSMPKFEFTVEEKEVDYEIKKALEDRFVQDVNIEKDLTYNFTEEVKTNVIEKKKFNFDIVGLVHATYIVCQSDEGMFLIDQHAACERINYEKVVKSLGKETKGQLQLLVPYVLEYPLNECIIIKNKLDKIKEIGIEIEEFGSGSFSVNKVPTWLPKDKELEAIRKIIDLICKKKENFDKEKFNENVAIMISCKMSIKANDNITTEVIRYLIDNLEKCDNPWTCPHGRPTIIKWSKYELEKLFLRSV